jgi:hypothetical protein
MTAPKKKAPTAPKAPAAPEGVVEAKIGSLAIETNNKFEIVDNTDEPSATVPTAATSETVRKNKLNGFTVVDYE